MLEENQNGIPVLPTSGLIFRLIYFCVLNITFTPVNFRIKDPLFLVLKFLLKIIETVNTLLQKSGTKFLSISKNGDLSCSLKYVF